MIFQNLFSENFFKKKSYFWQITKRYFQILKNYYMKIMNILFIKSITEKVFSKLTLKTKPNRAYKAYSLFNICLLCQAGSMFHL